MCAPAMCRCVLSLATIAFLATTGWVAADNSQVRPVLVSEQVAIHETGTVVLKRNSALDLDTGRQMRITDGEFDLKTFEPSGPFWQTDDVWFVVEGANSGNESRLMGSRAAFSNANNSAYSPRDCMREGMLVSDGINLRTTPGGSWFCYRTGDGRAGQMRLSTVAVIGDPIGDLKIEFTTYGSR